jgi:hypothetical protein
VLALVYDELTIDHDSPDAFRELVRIVERRSINDLVGVENDHIGGVPDLQSPAIGQAELVSRHPGHFVDRRFE